MFKLLIALLALSISPLVVADVAEEANLNAAEVRVNDLLKLSKSDRKEASKNRELASESEEDKVRLQEFEAIFKED